MSASQATTSTPAAWSWSSDSWSSGAAGDWSAEWSSKAGWSKAGWWSPDEVGGRTAGDSTGWWSRPASGQPAAWAANGWSADQALKVPPVVEVRPAAKAMPIVKSPSVVKSPQDVTTQSPAKQTVPAFLQAVSAAKASPVAPWTAQGPPVVAALPIKPQAKGLASIDEGVEDEAAERMDPEFQEQEFSLASLWLESGRRCQHWCRWVQKIDTRSRRTERGIIDI